MWMPTAFLHAPPPQEYGKARIWSSPRDCFGWERESQEEGNFRRILSVYGWGIWQCCIYLICWENTVLCFAFTIHSEISKIICWEFSSWSLPSLLNTAAQRETPWWESHKSQLSIPTSIAVGHCCWLSNKARIRVRKLGNYECCTSQKLEKSTEQKVTERE